MHIIITLMHFKGNNFAGDKKEQDIHSRIVLKL